MTVDSAKIAQSSQFKLKKDSFGSGINGSVLRDFSQALQ
jgi:hypothetical protein